MPDYRAVNISELTPGSVLMTAVFDQRRAKLLHAGIKVDERLISGLRKRGITEVLVKSNVRAIVSPSPTTVKAAEETTDDTVRVQRCGGCRSIIDIHPPVPETKATVWRCNNCGAIYFGGDESSASLRGLAILDQTIASPFARIADVSRRPVSNSIPPENVRRLAKSLAADETTWADRRQHKRYPVTVPVVVLPLAPDFRVSGESISMTTANVSLGGAALLHTRFVDAPYLAIDFTAAGLELLQVVFKVLRCRSIGPAYDIGGKFISRVS